MRGARQLDGAAGGLGSPLRSIPESGRVERFPAMNVAHIHTVLIACSPE